MQWMDIKTWTGLTMEESIRMAEDRDKWRKYVHGVANPRIKEGWKTELIGSSLLAQAGWYKNTTSALSQRSAACVWTPTLKYTELPAQPIPSQRTVCVWMHHQG